MRQQARTRRPGAGVPSHIAMSLTAKSHGHSERESALRTLLEELLRAGVSAVDPETLVADRLQHGPALPEHSGLVLLAVGKAAAGMARGATRVVGTETRGLVVCPTATDMRGLDVVVGDHPIPGSDSFDAGRRLMAAAVDAGPEDLVLVLLSGGASAMAEVPASGVSEQQIIDATASLLASGSPITEINEQRKVLSALKGGGLTQAARPARVVTFAISDVPAAAPDLIGSGPTTGSDTFEVLADGSTAAQAVAQACREAGLEPEMLADPIAGPASSAGRSLGRTSIRLSEGSALVGFGETTVRVEGTGRGGRNQELALAAALEIAGTSALVGSIGSDGLDGPTKNAGAIVDGTTIARASVLGLDAAAHLAAHDSATFLEAVGDVVVTGPTGTNVGDLVVAIKP